MLRSPTGLIQKSSVGDFDEAIAEFDEVVTNGKEQEWPKPEPTAT